jgi:AcrR family transcriptional regulator
MNILYRSPTIASPDADVKTNIRFFMYAGSMPKVSQAHRDARREQILDAAKRCFLRDGFHETSMQDLFAESGLSAGAVYRYFPGKTDMIRAIALENIAEVVDVVHTLAARPHEDGLGAALAEVLQIVARKHAEQGLGAIAVLVWGEALRNRELADWISGEIARMRVDLAEIVREHQSAGALPADVDPMAIAGLVMSIVPGFILQLAVFGEASVEGASAAARALFP